MATNTRKAPAKSNRAAKAKAAKATAPTTQPVKRSPSEIMAKATESSDPRDLAVAAAELSMFNPEDLDPETAEFVTNHATNVIALVTTSESHEDTARNAYVAAQQASTVARHVMCVYAYGATKVSKLFKQTELAEMWAKPDADGNMVPMSKQDIGSYVTAGQAAVKAKLTDQHAPVTVAIQRAKRDGKSGLDALEIKGKPNTTDVQRAITAAASSAKVTDEKSLVTFVQGHVREAGKKRGAQTNTRTQRGQSFDADDLGVTVPREAHTLIKRVVQLAKSKTELAGAGVINAQPDMSGRDALIALHTKLGEYLRATAPKQQGTSK